MNEPLSPSYPEADLVAGLQTHNATIFEVIYERYAPTLLGILRRIIHDPDEAADLLQDVFVKIWRQGHRYDPAQGRLFTWFITLTRRTAFDYLSAKKSSCLHYVDVLPNQLSFSYTPSYDHIGVEKQMEAILEERYRRLIYMVYWQGYTREAVADELSLPIGTVKTRLRTAIQLLRQALTSNEKTKLSWVS